MKKKLAILGAGPAGMVAAYELMKHSHEYEVHVFERDVRVGGMAGSFEYNGQIVDFGPHRFFSKIDKANEIFEEVLAQDAVKVKRLTRMYYNKKFFLYPIQLGDVIKKFTLLELAHMGISYIWAKVFPFKDTSTFETFIINNFGKKLYSTFFKNYTEKLRGIKCSELESQWAAQRIKGVSIMAILKQGLFGSGKQKVKSWVDEFLYPRYGNGYLYEKMQALLEKKGVHFHLSTPITQFSSEGDVLMVNGDAYDKVVSTIPINYLLHLNTTTPHAVTEHMNHLKFRNTILVYATLDTKEVFPDNWIYLHSANVEAGRMTNFNNWSPDQIKDKSKTYVCLEYRDNRDGKLWNLSDKELYAVAQRDLATITGISADKISHFHVEKINNSYPIYNKGYERHLSKVEEYVDTIKNLQVIGRSGSFKYNNQDHSMYMGYLAAKNLLGEHHNLWEINSDSEYHEEKKGS